MNTSVRTQAIAPDADFFRALEVKRTQALVARDMSAIESLHAPDYELISPPGRVMTRERYLSLLAAEPFYANWEHGAMRVRVSEGMAAIRYQAKITFPSGKVVDCWHTDVYALEAGRWQAVWSQATQLPPNPAPMALPSPNLHTARLLLRPFTQADTDAIFALHSNQRVVRYWDAPPWRERAQAERFIAACRQLEHEGTGARLAIERAADRVFIGWCCLVKWDPGYRSATLGYCFDDAVWGQGFATEAASALLQWAFDTLDLNRVQAEADTRNTASGRVLEKLRFVREGTRREDCVVDGEVSDSWVYGLLRREWQQVPSRSAAG